MRPTVRSFVCLAMTVVLPHAVFAVPGGMPATSTHVGLNGHSGSVRSTRTASASAGPRSGAHESGRSTTVTTVMPSHQREHTMARLQAVLISGTTSRWAKAAAFEELQQLRGGRSIWPSGPMPPR
jgi:hypothetical protein